MIKQKDESRKEMLMRIGSDPAVPNVLGLVAVLTLEIDRLLDERRELMAALRGFPGRNCSPSELLLWLSVRETVLRKAEGGGM